MKKSYLTAVVMLMCLLGAGVVSARAQTTDAVVVNVPFEFVAEGATLPAGEYRVSRLDPGVGQELFISGSNQAGAFLLPLAFEDGAAGKPAVTFEHVGDKYFLSTIKTLRGVFTMSASRETVMLGNANSPSPRTSFGSGGQ